MRFSKLDDEGKTEKWNSNGNEKEETTSKYAEIKAKRGILARFRE
jgi:hypothetical protein